jgi:hypothetical protein
MIASASEFTYDFPPYSRAPTPEQVKCISSCHHALSASRARDEETQGPPDMFQMPCHS